MKKIYIFIIVCSAIFINAYRDVFEYEKDESIDVSQVLNMVEFNQRYYSDLEKIKAIGAPDSLAPIIYDKSVKWGFDFVLVTRLVKIESNFNKYAVSNKGAIGLTQTMPITLKQFNLPLSYDEAVNLENGLYILNRNLEYYGTMEKALHAYNGGWRAVRDEFNKPYVLKVMGS